MLIGDTNCHFGKDVGKRFYGRTTKSAKALLNIVNTCNMVVLDGDDAICDGPTYTFKVDGVGQSYVDHCICSQSVASYTSKIDILPDEILNTSDHLPLVVRLKCYESNCGVQNLPSITMSRVAWNKMSEQDVISMYTEPLATSIMHLEEQLDSLKDVKNNLSLRIEQLINILYECIHDKCKSLPTRKFKKHLKPYWSKLLKTLNDEKKRTWDALKKNRKRDPIDTNEA